MHSFIFNRVFNSIYNNIIIKNNNNLIQIILTKIIKKQIYYIYLNL